MKQVLVTGGCGFIGSHLVDKLLGEGFKVIVIDNCSTGRVKNLVHIKHNDSLKIIVKDLNDPALNLEEITTQVDYVYHLAALADIVPSIQQPHNYYRSNVEATFRLIESCKNKPNIKKFLYAASSSCYGIPDKYPTPETAEIRPEYPYALTKRLGEEIVLHWGKLYKIPVVTCRFFNVYGPRSRTSGTYGAVFGVFKLGKNVRKIKSSVYAPAKVDDPDLIDDDDEFDQKS